MRNVVAAHARVGFGAVRRAPDAAPSSSLRRRNAAASASTSSASEGEPRRARRRRRDLVRSHGLGGGLVEWWAHGLRTVDRKADALLAQGLGKQDADGDGSAQSINMAGFIKEMARQLRPDVGWFVFGVVALLVAAAAELAMPHFTAKTIFSVTSAAGGGPADTARFISLIRTIVALAGIYAVSAAVRGMTFGYLNQQFVYRLRQELFRNLVRQGIVFHDQAEVGVLTSRLTSDCR